LALGGRGLRTHTFAIASTSEAQDRAFSDGNFLDGVKILIERLVIQNTSKARKRRFELVRIEPDDFVAASLHGPKSPMDASTFVAS